MSPVNSNVITASSGTLNAESLNALLNGVGNPAAANNGLRSIPYNPADPNATLAAITERGQQRYEQDYVPVEDRAIESLDDMSIIDDAQRRVADKSSIGRSLQRSARNASRYGFRHSTAQVKNAIHGAAINKASSDADILNEARINQFDRNRNFRNQLINIGRGVSNDASSGLQDAATMQTNRENANRQASAAKKSQNMQMAAAAAMMLVMMM